MEAANGSGKPKGIRQDIAIPRDLTKILISVILIKLQPIKGSVWVRFAFLSVIHPPGNCLYGHRKNRHFFYTNDKIGLIFAPAHKIPYTVHL